MRCVIARFPFDLIKSEVEQMAKGVKPEPATGMCAKIGGKLYPVKQVGALITKQDRRDFTGEEVRRALVRLGFTCAPAPTAPAPEPTPPGDILA